MRPRVLVVTAVDREAGTFTVASSRLSYRAIRCVPRSGPRSATPAVPDQRDGAAVL